MVIFWILQFTKYVILYRVLVNFTISYHLLTSDTLRLVYVRLNISLTIGSLMQKIELAQVLGI